MKKYICFLFLAVCFLFAGCKETVKIYDVMSEQTSLYFYGKADEFECNISVGKREERYIVDGIHGKTVDFSLVTLKVDEVVDDRVEIVLELNGKNSTIVLELNPLNMTYMADLGYGLKGDDSIKIVYNECEAVLNNISNSFNVDYKKAIDISMSELGREIEDFYKNKVLSCEGYLRIVEGERFGQQGYFWLFNIVGKEKSSSNILISVDDEKIILRG